jgi:uncharacterized integral membrane protein
MKRGLVWILCLVVAIVAAAFALLNEASVRLDFHFFAFELSLGLVVMTSVLAGFLLAGITLTMTVIFPARLRMRALRRELDLLRQSGSKCP